MREHSPWNGPWGPRRPHHHPEGHHPEGHHPEGLSPYGPPHEHPHERGRRGGHGGPGRRGPGGRGRAQRGDVRAAALLLLAEEPMHGYQLMQAMAERTGGAWRPSPGAVYPTLAQLEDEGLVTVRSEGGRKLVTLTDAGREQAAGLEDPFVALSDDADRPDLRRILEDVHHAARQISSRGSAAQLEAAAKALAEARRALYLLLADGDG
ncbi:DNA-binding PadR family transcriptional regulator [Motilibacter rhizosphaerae]|uniref:DNA-binding PadR family transcriptional regulator n=1 Tax=Motilibacter rhizosphaerae TaxID=598652 RepID=A0A4Q7NS95_9ACTN|nr:PadR family transcriptional regulator [Motilibacter rhizosphaerae]RZS89814.1 DNA-binding PadR family transcriptional regulator [Motilibacter rhizosphaerae]